MKNKLTILASLTALCLITESTAWSQPAGTTAAQPTGRRGPGAQAGGTTGVPQRDAPQVNWATQADPTPQTMEGLIDLKRANIGDSVISTRSDHALIIRHTETDPRTLGMMEEDMNIMGRILEKAARQSAENRLQEAMGVRLLALSGQSSARNSEIEGYGAIFQLAVGFPLTGPTEKREENVTKEPVSSDWDETRRELYGPRGGGRRGGPAGTPAPTFDPKQVEGLKTAILEALKNASNMRNLKSDEGVTVVVNSGGRFATATENWIITYDNGKSVVTDSPRIPGNSSGSTVGGSRSNQSVATTPAPTAVRRAGPLNMAESILTIRVKKSDIDAFAKEKLSLEEFRKTATMQLY